MNGLSGLLALAVIVGALGCALAAEAPSAARERGARVFSDNCVLCHGEDARGHGRAARLFTPPPADLTQGAGDEAFREQIIRKGGAALGRSAAMPAWGDLLSPQQIDDLLVFVRSLRPQSGDSNSAAP